MLDARRQAEAIGRLQLIQFVGLEMEKLVDGIQRTVVEEIEGYEAHPRRRIADLMDIIREDTFEMKEKYGDDRRTEITGDVSDFNMEDLIAQEDVVVTVSHEGYIKRLPVDTYRARAAAGAASRGPNPRKGILSSICSSPTRTIICCFSRTRAACTSGVFTMCRR